MDYEQQGLLHAMFVRQARATPDKVAIVTNDGKQMTFRELDEVTDVLATNLRIQGVKPDSIVGIYLEKCVEYTVSYIAILKAGGAYMPMDISYPVSLIQDIINDSKPVIITDPIQAEHALKGIDNVIIVKDGWIERLREENKKHEGFKTGPDVCLDNLAYTVYSSGTTGKPKGIQCPHRGAVFSYHWRHNAYPYRDDEREACNIFFVWEMLRPILKGVPMYIIPDNVIYDPHLLCKFLQSHQITRMLFTSSLLETVLNTEGIDLQTSFKSMRTIIFCGEVVMTGLLERCMKTLPWIQFVNLYSVSEAHDIACADLSQWYNQDKKRLEKVKFCPVGKLLPGVHIVIMDEKSQPQPLGVPGEIYVGGPTLARGYLNRPELDAKKFIPRPESVPAKVGDRLYKSGDWGYMLSDGSFEICGRCDSMVKIRGYSIETQAVEAALLELDMVNACMVEVMGGEGEDKYLVAYVVPEGQTTKKKVRAALKRRLPFYMIPSYFVFLTSIPLLPASGKLDKKSLPPLDTGNDGSVDPDGAPSTDTETKLMPLWAEVLAHKAVDVQESFFDLGGHSLLATKLLSKIKSTFGVAVSVRELFIYPTVSSMARLLDHRIQKPDSHTSPVREPELDLKKEVERHDQAVLGLDMQLRAFWRSSQHNSQRWTNGRILLTGATGFLGSFILRDLLLKSKAYIFCLVRETANSDSKGKDRIEKTLQQFGILPPGGIGDADKGTEEQQQIATQIWNRVSVIKGDVGLVNMGVSEEDYTYLSTEIDLIIHAAANVNLIYPYRALHGPNVLGTENVVLFACTNKIKPLHFISTDGVFPHGLTDCCEEADMNQYADQLTDGYSQSKWVAEQLVKKAMDRGLPAAIYRPGNLAGDSKESNWNQQDFTLLMLQGCMKTKCAPQLDWAVEMTPVDFVSSFIVHLAQTPTLSLGKVFHLVNTSTLPARWLFEWCSAHGYPFKTVAYCDWVKEVHNVKEDGLLQKLLESIFQDPTYFAKLSTYKRDNVEAVLQTLKWSYPEISSSLLNLYFKKLADQGVFPRPRSSTGSDQPLKGRVAIVTGASSGIGAAIAQHLSRAGAMVAVAARRKERLEELKTSIEKEGGVAIGVQTDVTKKEDTIKLVQHTESTLGPVDILVNCAGIMYYTLFENIQDDQWNREIDINCKGVVNCTSAVLKGMISRTKGHIINISSDAGRKGFPGLAVYSGTKFFVEGLSQALRQEVCGKGIRVTCVQPGDVKTELVTHCTDEQAVKDFGVGDSVKILHPEDIARAIVYATSQPPYVAVNEILIQPRETPI